MKEFKEGENVFAYDDTGAVVFGEYMYKTEDGHCVKSGTVVGTWDNAYPAKHVSRALPSGLKVGDKAQFTDWAWSSAIAIESNVVATTSDGRFIDSEDRVWKKCRPVAKKYRKKKASEIIKLLEYQGFVYDGNKYCKNYTGCRLRYSLGYILAGCGEEVRDGGKYPDEWLEEA